MRSIRDRGIICNNVKICVANECEVRVNKVNISEGDKGIGGHGGKGDASILGVEKM